MKHLLVLGLLAAGIMPLTNPASDRIPATDASKLYVASYGCNLKVVYSSADTISIQPVRAEQATSSVERRMTREKDTIKLYFFPHGFDLETDVLSPNQMMKLMGHYLVSGGTEQQLTLTIPARLKDAVTVRVVFGEYLEVKDTSAGK